MIGGVSGRKFFSDLKREISEDNISNGAAALAYFLRLAIFPAMMFLLALVSYLPVQNLEKAILDFLNQVMPGDSSKMFLGVIKEVTTKKQTGLLSFGALGTLWAASSGIVAVMQQLNITYDVKEGRSFIRVRMMALGLTILLGLLLLSAFFLIVLGGKIQGWLSAMTGSQNLLLTFFAALRWVIVLGAMLLAFSLAFYLGPDVEQKFKFVTPGSVTAVALLVGTTLGFRFYVDRFSNFSATYGGIGAVIILELWLYISGLALLLGSEINALIEHYHPAGKRKGEKQEKAAA